MSGKKAEFDHKSRLHLNAAEGWLGLGDWKEAEGELAQIAEALRNHPEVLQARYLVESEAKRWDACVEIGRALVDLMPEDSFGGSIKRTLCGERRGEACKRLTTRCARRSTG